MVVSERVTERVAAGVRSLRPPMAAFVAGVLFHGADHLYRGMMASPPSIMVAGSAQFVLVLVAVLAVWSGRSWAPSFAATVALASVVGFTYAHLLPAWWPAYSDSYVTGARIGVTWFSWVSVVAEMGTALVLAVLALRVRPAERT